MVRRRLNKKVAFLGSAFFVIIALVLIIIVFQMKRSPLEFIKDAEAAIQTARQSTDQKTKDQYYEIAIRKYSSAFGGMKTNEERKDILTAMVDLFVETQNWPYVLDCWDKIIFIEPENIKAQYNRLRYFEIIGDSGVPNVWSQAYDYASKFLETAQNKDLMNHDLSSLKMPDLEKDHNATQKLGTYLYIIKGKGAFEQANMGSVTNTEEMFDESISDFEKAKELEPNNIDVYLNLAKSVLAKGDLAATKGGEDKRDKAGKEALAILEQAVENASDKVKAYINLINYKVVLARDNEPEQVQKEFKSLESEYLSLETKYPTSPDVHEALSMFYSIFSQYTRLEESRKYLDKSIDEITKAMSLNEKNAVYAIQITDLYYRRYSVYNNRQDLTKATEIAKNALSWPDTQNTSGPGNNIRLRNNFLLNIFLADSYTEQVINPLVAITDSDKQTLLSGAQDAVKAIEAIIRTNEDPTVIKWQGMLELAKGNKQEAIIKLNKAYEQLKSVKPAQPPWPLDIEFAKLSYTLAKIFMYTEEIGKAYEFLLNAHYSGITEIKPEARLDYVEVILNFNRYTDALDNIEAFDEDYGPSKRSRELRVKTYIYSNKYDEAQKEIDKLSPADIETIKLQLALVESKMHQIQISLAKSGINVDPQEQGKREISDQKVKQEIKGYMEAAAGFINKIIDMKPELVNQSSIINICRAGLTIDDISQAKQLVDKYLTKFPNDIGIQIYKQVMSEPEPGIVTQQRYTEIQEKIILNISGPIQRASNLGILYKNNNDIPKAIEQFNIAIDAAKSADLTKNSTEMENFNIAVSSLFDIALSTKKNDIAENILKIAREKNLDGFHGLFYEARFAAAKNDLNNALTKVDECLKERPVSSQAYLFRSNINAALGNEYAYIEDISKAASINPLDSTISRRYAIALYKIAQNSENEISKAQHDETRDALEKAVALNQGDMELLGLYTEFISSAEPKRAIAIRQDMLAAAPSLDNAVMLGTLAMNIAGNTSNTDEKEAFFDIAGSALEQARKMDPNDRDVLIYYTKYLRARGRDEEAKKLLESSKDNILLANELFQDGNYESARTILEKLYVNDSNNIEILRGLLLVTQKMNDKDAVKKYSTELLSAENNQNNLILQIRAYITVGLYSDAENKLQSLKEKYPDDKNVSILQAWLYYKQGNAKKALDTINAYIQDIKNNPSAWQLRSDINIALNEYQRAISDLKTCQSLTNDPAIGVSLAKVYLQIGNYQDAEKELKEIAGKENPPMEAYLLLESLYQKLNRKTALENLYDSIIKQYPDNAQWLDKAAEYALQTKEFERAETLYKKSCDMIRESYTGDKKGKEIDNEQFVSSFDGYLISLVSQKDSHPEKAELALKEAAEYINSDYAPLAYLRMAQASNVLKKDDDVKKYARLAMEKAISGDNYVMNTIQEIYPVLQFDEMSKYVSQMLEKNPDSPAANYAMYFIMRANKKYPEAVEYISKCINLIGKDSPIRYEYILQKDETLLYEYNNTSDNKYINDAIKDYESLLSEMPNNIQVLNNLAYMLAESEQRLSDALDYSKRAQDIKPNDPGFLDTYAFVLLKNKQYNEADKAIEKSLSLYTEQGQNTIPAEVYEHKGMIKEKLEKKEEAFAAYKKAMELGSGYFTQKTKDRINQAIERVSP